jgi:hypothetical protein
MALLLLCWGDLLVPLVVLHIIAGAALPAGSWHQVAALPHLTGCTIAAAAAAAATGVAAGPFHDSV